MSQPYDVPLPFEWDDENPRGWEKATIRWDDLGRYIEIHDYVWEGEDDEHS